MKYLTLEDTSLNNIKHAVGFSFFKCVNRDMNYWPLNKKVLTLYTIHVKTFLQKLLFQNLVKMSYYHLWKNNA